MKKKLTELLSCMLALVMTLSIALIGPIKAEAAEATFSGTVSDKTTSSMLYLVTSGGTMQIKIDGTTDMSAAKFLLPGNTVTCNCYVSSDEYWHASKISGSSSAGRVSVDTSKTYTVTGTAAKGTTEDTLFLKMSDGTMELKVDTSTDVSGLSVLVIGKSLQVTCARGADAYMHALSISDTGTSATTVAAGTGTVAATTATSSITGTVNKSTTSSVLFLNTSGGVMEITIDSATDLSGSRTLLPGESVSVGFYRGSDACNHAASIVKTSSKQSAVTTLNPAQFTVTGTVGSKTSENTLYLVNKDGTMEIRLDANTNFSGTGFLILNKKVQVVCQSGADEYLHAISITNN